MDRSLNFKKVAVFFACAHIAILTLSNFLVQYPVDVLGLHITMGAFVFPFVYVATDLAMRIYGARTARATVCLVMLPTLILTYVISSLFYKGDFQGFASLFDPNSVVVRIAFASFGAYALGQFLDIYVFSKLRKMKGWCVAPLCSSNTGNFIDVITFFALAFAGGANAFMAENWFNIAISQYLFNVVFTTCVTIPIYGAILSRTKKDLSQWKQQAA